MDLQFVVFPFSVVFCFVSFFSQLIQGIHTSCMVRVWPHQSGDHGVSRRVVHSCRGCPVRRVFNSFSDYAG